MGWSPAHPVLAGPEGGAGTLLPCYLKKREPRGAGKLLPGPLGASASLAPSIREAELQD